MLKDFLIELFDKANKAQMDGNELVKMYERRFNLGLEAGFSEEEILARFGSVDEILASNIVSKNQEQQQEVNVDLEQLTLAIADNCDISIEKGSCFNIEIDEDMQKYYSLVIDEKNLILKRKDGVSSRSKSYDDVVVTIPANSIIKNCDISVINGDVNCDAEMTIENLRINGVSADLNFDLIKAKEVSFSTVSGDLNVDAIAALKCEVSTVSGDIDFEQAAIENLVISTISGDANIYGIIDKVETSSVSGDINIDHKSQKTSLKDALSSFFRL